MHLYMAETLASWMASLLTVWWGKRASEEVRKDEEEEKSRISAALWQTAKHTTSLAPEGSCTWKRVKQK